MTRSVVALNKVAEVNPATGTGDLLATEELDFFPMAAVGADQTIARTSERRPLGQVSTGFTNFRDGDILVAKITPCFENGKIARASVTTGTAFGSTEFHVVRCGPDLDDRYLVHFLRRPEVRVEGQRKMTGSGGQRRVPKHFLESLKIPLPSLPEQRRIAAILDKADALRTMRREASALLSRLAPSIFLEMFGDPVANPKGWPRHALGDVLTGIDSGWSPVCLERPAEADEWGVLKLGAVTSCVYEHRANKALPLGVEPDAAIEVKPGDLLFSRKNTYELVAACAYVDSTRPRLMMSDLIFRLQVRDEERLNKRFLHALLTNPRKRAEVQKLAGGSAGSMPNISKAKLLGMQVELPPISLQQEFASRVERMGRIKAKSDAAAFEADLLFSSLQHRAFQGELCLPGSQRHGVRNLLEHVA